MEKFEQTQHSLLASWTSFLSRRLEKPSDSFMIPRVASLFTASRPKRRNTNCAKSSGFSWAKEESHSWLRMMHERKFVALIQSLDQVLVALSRRRADDTLREQDSIPRSVDQSERYCQDRVVNRQDHRLHWLRYRSHCYGHWWSQHGSCGCNYAPRASRRRIQHCAYQGCH